MHSGNDIVLLSEFVLPLSDSEADVAQLRRQGSRPYPQKGRSNNSGSSESETTQNQSGELSLN